MARLGNWIEPFPEGIYVKPADAWVDPLCPKAKALVTHGREDALMHWCVTRQTKARDLNLVGYEDEDDRYGSRPASHHSAIIPATPASPSLA